MQDRSPPARQNLLATHGRTIHWVTFSERDKGKQFFGVGFALISGTDEKAIKRKRDQLGHPSHFAELCPSGPQQSFDLEVNRGLFPRLLSIS